MSDKKFILVGYSGHALIVVEAAKRAGLVPTGYIDLIEAKFNPFNIEYLGSEDNPNALIWLRSEKLIHGIGNNSIRYRIAVTLRKKGKEFSTVIHPNAIVSSYSKIASGSFVAQGAIVNPFAEIGQDVILNTGCIIEHECQIQNAAHIAPGAILTGNVKVGKRSFVGANAVVKQGLTIGDDVIIGAGSVVLHDIDCNETWVGNPARKIR
ncbi:MAG: acetyltransferase [Candidatus Levybacteria bacterium]|nr:acetyltransferase [Candidatus Levybacteria bacterium]